MCQLAVCIALTDIPGGTHMHPAAHLTGVESERGPVDLGVCLGSGGVSWELSWLFLGLSALLVFHLSHDVSVCLL